MPPEGYSSITVSDEVIKKLTLVMTEYDCETLGEAIEIASAIALERDETELAQILADKLEN